jgi:hypothetical protein
MARTDWKQAEGRVTSIDTIYPRGRKQLIVKFDYVVAGQSFEGKFGTFDSVHEGDPIIVNYNASNPKQNQFETRDKRKNRIAFGIATLWLVAFLLLLWFTRK